jgi:hypothetical protein
MKQAICGVQKFQKSRWRYWAVAERGHSAELGGYDTYGLLAASTEPDGRGAVKLLHDVSPDGETVRSMAEKFTKHQLSPVHLLDVVEDMLP